MVDVDFFVEGDVFDYSGVGAGVSDRGAMNISSLLTLSCQVLLDNSIQQLVPLKHHDLLHIAFGQGGVQELDKVDAGQEAGGIGMVMGAERWPGRDLEISFGIGGNRFFAAKCNSYIRRRVFATIHHHPALDSHGRLFGSHNSIAHQATIFRMNRQMTCWRRDRKIHHRFLTGAAKATTGLRGHLIPTFRTVAGYVKVYRLLHKLHFDLRCSGSLDYIHGFGWPRGIDPLAGTFHTE